MCLRWAFQPRTLIVRCLTTFPRFLTLWQIVKRAREHGPIPSPCLKCPRRARGGMRIVRYLLRFSLRPERWQIVIRLRYCSSAAGVLAWSGVLVLAGEMPAPTAASPVSRTAVTIAITAA